MKKILAIIGSASEHSTNQKLVDNFVEMTKADFDVDVFTDLKLLPHFDPKLSADDPPLQVVALREKIAIADGLVICTPEYIYSIPSGLKNAIEWCIATTVFSNKPCGLITASLDGEIGHQELQLIMKTATARFTPDTSLLIKAIKAKINAGGQIIDKNTMDNLRNFIVAFKSLVNEGQDQNGA